MHCRHLLCTMHKSCTLKSRNSVVICIHYLPKELLVLRGDETLSLSWTNELFRVMWPVPKDKASGLIFFLRQERNQILRADTIYDLNARLPTGGRPSNSERGFHSYIDTDALTLPLLGNGPHPFLVLSESIWTCLRCMCCANTQYGIEESVVMRCGWGFSWV